MSLLCSYALFVQCEEESEKNVRIFCLVFLRERKMKCFCVFTNRRFENYPSWYFKRYTKQMHDVISKKNADH